MKGTGHRARPLYWRVADDILANIEAGAWHGGDKLPSERELCDRYKVSQITVRRALRELEHLERVYSQHGIGWFVSPTALAQDLHDVALVVPEFGWLEAELARQLSTRLPSHGACLRLAVTDATSLREEDVFALLAQQGADAFLVAPGGPERGAGQRYASLLSDLGIPSALLLRPVSDVPLPTVSLNENEAMRSLTEHLLSLGHRRIAYLGPSPALIEGHASYWGFATALWEHGLELPLDWVFSGALSDQTDADRLGAVFAAEEGPTSLVCASDLSAAEAMAVLGAAGKSCPADVAIVGVGDRAFGRLLPTPLTTYRLDLPNLVHASLSAALALLSGATIANHTFSGELVVRQSCGAGSTFQ